jgi:acetyl esterase/lipase
MKKAHWSMILTVLSLIGSNLLVSCSPSPPYGGVAFEQATFTYLQEGDCELQADVYSPTGGEATPAILWLHPGGMITGGRDWIDPNQLVLYLEAGYTVVAIDHRLAPENKLEAIVSDVEAAYAWLITEGPALFNIDPQRVAVVGHSAGGYLTLLTGFRVEPRPKALVAFYGYGDLTGEWAVDPLESYDQRERITRDAAERSLGKSQDTCIPSDAQLDDRFDYYISARQQGVWSFAISGHDPVGEAAWFRDYESVFNVTSSYPPTMLLHGGADTDVPFSVAERMIDALEAGGVSYEFVTRTEWNHVFDQAESDSPAVREALRQVISFLDRYVK